MCLNRCHHLGRLGLCRFGIHQYQWNNFDLEVLHGQESGGKMEKEISENILKIFLDNFVLMKNSAKLVLVNSGTKNMQHFQEY